MTTALAALDERCRQLTLIGADAQPSEAKVADLRASLGDASSRVRAAAARALGALLAGAGGGKGLPEATGAAIARELAARAVIDPHLWARQAAAGALSHAPPAALEHLTGLLSGGDAEARERAVRAVGHWGRGSASSRVRAAESVLADALGDASPRVRAAESALADALGDASPRVRAAAAEALGALPSLAPAVAALAATARGDADPAVRVAALAALGDAGVAGRDDAFEAVEAALDDATDEVALAALEAALVARRPDRAARLLSPLGRCAASRSDGVRGAALRVLGSLGGDASGALDAVLAATKHRSWAVREPAVEAFGEITARDPASAEEHLISLVTAGSSGERYLALRLLHRQGTLPERLVPAIWAAALDDQDPRTRELARELIGRSPEPSADAIERLSALLGSRKPSVRMRAATVASELGAAAAPLVPALLRALPDPSRQVRRAALEALRALGEAALPGVPPALRRAFEGESSVVHAARATLRELAPGLAPEVRSRINALAQTNAPEAQLLALVEEVLPEHARGDFAHVARVRARWYASLAPELGVATPAAPTTPATPATPAAMLAVTSEGPADSPREAALAALAAAGEAARRRRRPETGPGWRQREVAWLLAYAVRRLMIPA
ncbi:MAG: HEAT repeat domain-containing protein [Polyangiaceae bacterium]|nr:HEAT repeat domain-containing protein [Polyangiaceae bacterium]